MQKHCLILLCRLKTEPNWKVKVLPLLLNYYQIYRGRKIWKKIAACWDKHWRSKTRFCVALLKIQRFMMCSTTTIPKKNLYADQDNYENVTMVKIWFTICIGVLWPRQVKNVSDGEWGRPRHPHRQQPDRWWWWLSLTYLIHDDQQLSHIWHMLYLLKEAKVSFELIWKSKNQISSFFIHHPPHQNSFAEYLKMMTTTHLQFSMCKLKFYSSGSQEKRSDYLFKS